MTGSTPVRVEVLGGCGAWPADGRACGGYLLESDGFRLLIDPGYGVATALSEQLGPGEVDAVFVSHGHPDHCADLHPLLRGRVLQGVSTPLPVHAPENAIDRVVSWEGSGELDGAYSPVVLADGDDLEIGPFRAMTRRLPHFVPNLGVRLSAGGRAVAFTGDAGPSLEMPNLSANADLLIAEATFASDMPATFVGNLSTAVDVARIAANAEVDRLLLTHLWPATDPGDHLGAATENFARDLNVAAPGLTFELD